MGVGHISNAKLKLPESGKQEPGAMHCITPGKIASLRVTAGEGSRLVRGFLQQKDNLVVTGYHWAGFSKAGSYMTLHEEKSGTPERTLSRLGSNANCLSDSL